MGRGGENTKPQNENYWHVLSRRSKNSAVRKNTLPVSDKGKIMGGQVRDLSAAAAAYQYGSCFAFRSLQKRGFLSSGKSSKKGLSHDSNGNSFFSGFDNLCTVSPSPTTPHIATASAPISAYPHGHQLIDREGGTCKGRGLSYSDVCRKNIGVSSKAKSVSFSDREDLTHSSQIGGHHVIGAPTFSKDSGFRPEQTGTQHPAAAGKRTAGPCLKATSQPAPTYSSGSTDYRRPTPGRRARWVAATESPRGRGQFVNKFMPRTLSRGSGFGKRTLKALDLFSGTGSVGTQLSKWGFQVTSLDNSPSCKADLCLDILGWDYKRQYSPGHFQVITASVPCEEYSPAKTTQVRDLGKADILAKKSVGNYRILPARFVVD